MRYRGDFPPEWKLWTYLAGKEGVLGRFQVNKVSTKHEGDVRVVVSDARVAGAKWWLMG